MPEAVRVQTECPVCRSKEGLTASGLKTCAPYTHLGEFELHVCSKCSNGITLPRKPFLALPVDFTGEKSSSLFTSVFETFLKFRLRKLARGSPGQSLLEVGAGALGFAKAAARAGYNVTAIEGNAANRVHEDPSAKVKCIYSLITDDLIKNLGTFDHVTMWHSLEHFDDPVQALKMILQTLKPNGRIFISVPNFASHQSKFGGNLWAYLDIPNHMTNFTSLGLDCALERAGLEVERRYRFSFEYDVFGWYQTILNVITRSHNYFYNRSKKNRTDESYMPYPKFTKFVTAIGPIFAPVALLLSIWSALLGQPSCIEVSVKKKN